MRILVTGSTGLLGKRLCQRLYREGWDVVGMGRGAGHAPERLGFPYLQASLDNPNSLETALNREQSFVLVHLAWDLSQRASMSVQAACLTQFARLLEFCESHRPAGIIAAGTADELGSREGLLAEAAEPGPLRSAYGWSKAAACQLLSDWHARSTVPCIWLRPFTVYGPGQTGDMLIPYAVRQGLLRQPAKFSAGTQQRDFIYVDDVVDAFVRAIERFGSRAVGHETYHIGSGSPVTVRDVLGMIAHRLDAQHLFHFGEIGPRPEEPQRIGADIRLAQRQLGWSPCTSLDEGLGKLIQFASEERRCAA